MALAVGAISADYFLPQRPSVEENLVLLAGNSQCRVLSRIRLHVTSMYLKHLSIRIRDAKSTEFTREPSYEFVRRNIESIKTRQFDDLNLGKAILMPSLGSDYEEVRSNLWLSLEKEIKPHECEIYSYCGDGQSDPWNDSGCIWNFVYFFYNKQTKQVLYFACEGLRYIHIIFKPTSWHF